MALKLVDLHSSQLDIYLDQLLQQDSSRYNTGGCIKLKGRVERDKLVHLLTKIPFYFDSFRMKFDFSDEKPRIHIDDDIQSCSVEEVDFSSSRTACEQAFAWSQKQFNEPMSIEKSKLLFKFSLLKVSDLEYWIFCKSHHLICDGFGFTIVARYIADAYRDITSNSNASFSYPQYITEVINSSAFY